MFLRPEGVSSCAWTHLFRRVERRFGLCPEPARFKFSDWGYFIDRLPVLPKQDTGRIKRHMASEKKPGYREVRKGLDPFGSTRPRTEPLGSFTFKPFWLRRPVAGAAIVFAILAMFLTACGGSLMTLRAAVNENHRDDPAQARGKAVPPVLIRPAGNPLTTAAPVPAPRPEDTEPTPAATAQRPVHQRIGAMMEPTGRAIGVTCLIPARLTDFHCSIWYSTQRFSKLT